MNSILRRAFKLISTTCIFTGLVFFNSSCQFFTASKLDTEFHPGAKISFSNSLVSVALSKAVVNQPVLITLKLFDENAYPYVSNLPNVQISVSGGTSIGTVSAVTNHLDGSYTASFTGTTIGTATQVNVTVDGVLLTGTMPTIEIILGNYTALRITGNQTPLIGVCTPLTLTSLNVLGQTMPMTSATTIALSGGGRLGIYSDSNCTANISSVTFVPGQSSAPLFISDSRNEFIDIQATSSGVNTVDFFTLVSSGAPTLLQISGAAPIAAGSCVGPFTIYSEDANGNFASVSASKTINLSAGGSLSFYSDNACASPVSSVNLASATAATIFYLRDLVAERVLILASTSGLTQATLPALVSASNPVKLVFTGNATYPISTTCSGVMTLSSYDVYGNLAPLTAPTLVNFIGKGNSVLYSGAGCTSNFNSVTLAAGTSSYPIYFRDAVTENNLFSASATGFATAGLNYTMLAGAATKLAVTGPIANMTNNCAGPFVVTAKDGSNNVAPVSSSTQVNLTQGGAATFYTTSACSPSVGSVTIPTGASSQVFYMKDATPQTVTTTATDNAGLLTAVAFGSNVFSATGITITVGPATFSTGTCAGPYTVSTVNGTGAAVVGANTITLATTGSGLFYATAGCSPSVSSVAITAGNSTQQFYYQDAVNENVTFTASKSGFAKATFNAVVGTPSPTVLAISGTASFAAKSCNAFTFTAKNSGGVASPVALTNASLSFAGYGSGAFYTDSGCNTLASTPQISVGSTSATYYFKDTAAEMINLQAIATGYTTGFFTSTITAVAPSQITLSGPSQISIGNCSGAFTIKSLDDNRNVSAVSSSVSIQLSGNGSGSFYSDSNCSAATSTATISAATSTSTFYFKDAIQETLAFTANDISTSLGSARSAIVTINSPTMVASGADYSCAVVNSELWCWGTYQLFGPTSISDPIPRKISGLGTVSAVSVGASNYNALTCVIVDGGTVKCWGNGWASNVYGMLGNNSVDPNYTPTTPTGLESGVTAISSGLNFHSCAIKNGGVLCWGSNSNGQIGNNTTTDALVPTSVSGMSSGVTSISVGRIHTCAVMSGAAYCWGSNSTRQLGDGTAVVNALTPVAVSGISGTVLQISAGAGHSCAVTTTGALYCWGQSSHGEIGNGSTSTQSTAIQTFSSGATAVAAGTAHTCAIVNSIVQCWGSNGGNTSNPTGQVGINSIVNQVTPAAVLNLQSGATSISVASTQSCAIVNGSLFCWGYNLNGSIGLPSITRTNTPLPVSTLPSGSGVTQITATTNDTVCAIVNGSAKCWGARLGTGSSVIPTSPVFVSALTNNVTSIGNGYIDSCATAGGGAFCWGGASSALGNTTGTAAPTPAPVTGLSSGVTSISMGPSSRFACALLDDKTVTCWGNNSNGQLGDGTLIERFAPVPVVGLSNIMNLSVGSTHTCAVNLSGAVYCWGLNSSGQLGDGTTTDHSTPALVAGLPSNITAVSSGYNHTCALTSLQTMYCWGGNISFVNNLTGNSLILPMGQLGNNSGQNSLVPVQVQSLGGPVINIAAGVGNTCAVLQNHQAQCWGNNYSQQLGAGTLVSNSFLPVYVNNLTDAASITLGNGFACAASTTGGASCWGSNTTNQLAPGGLYYSAIPVEVSLP